MATVADLTAPYGNLLIAPRPGPGVCRRCFNLTDGYAHCWACAHGGDHLDQVAPISYSVAGGQLHHSLAAYKRTAAPWTTALVHGLAAVLWRHLEVHEACLSRSVAADRFPLVTTVPSTQARRETPHPLHSMVARLVRPTAGRTAPLLRTADRPVAPHTFSAERFLATRRLDGEPVLLIDDTWTTGASAQSAAAALKRAGAGPVVALVIGRHLNRDWHDNDQRLRTLPTRFDWDRCPFCTDRFTGAETPGNNDSAMVVGTTAAHRG